MYIEKWIECACQCRWDGWDCQSEAEYVTWSIGKAFLVSSCAGSTSAFTARLVVIQTSSSIVASIAYSLSFLQVTSFIIFLLKYCAGLAAFPLHSSTLHFQTDCRQITFSLSRIATVSNGTVNYDFHQDCLLSIKSPILICTCH